MLHIDIMPDVSILAAIALCMQLISVECERSFSVQNRLKSKFRASIKGEKINMLGPAKESYKPETAIRLRKEGTAGYSVHLNLGQ